MTPLSDRDHCILRSATNNIVKKETYNTSYEYCIVTGSHASLDRIVNGDCVVIPVLILVNLSNYQNLCQIDRFHS